LISEELIKTTIFSLSFTGLYENSCWTVEKFNREGEKGKTMHRKGEITYNINMMEFILMKIVLFINYSLEELSKTDLSENL